MTISPATAMRGFLCALLTVVTTAGPFAPAAEPVFPAEDWPRRSPADAGLDPAGLKAFCEFAAGRGCVTRDGCLVFAWGDPARRADVASAGKPVFAHFLFAAVQNGKIADLDEPVVKHEPRLGKLNPALDFKDRAITWRHLATQTSGYQVREKPGAAFCYNDWQMSLFWDTLFLKVYGAAYETVDRQVLRPLLTDPLGCQDQPTLMAFGVGDRPGRLAISPRDFCRFGLLYLHRGKWNGRQVLEERYAVMAVTSPLPASLPRAGTAPAEMLPGQRTMGSRSVPDNQCPHLGGYSFLWWVNGRDEKGRRLWPDAPEDAFGAFGHGGKRAMVVIPSRGLIVSWNDARLDGWEKVNGALKRLVDSVRDGRAEPATRPEKDASAGRGGK